jgi:hypothetical protein
MARPRSLNFDRIGTIASAICAVHCVITGLAFGLLSVAGLEFLGSIQAEIAFISVALAVGGVAIWHGVKRHHSYRPALLFASGVGLIVLKHFIWKEHVHEAGFHLEDIPSTLVSVAAGACLIGFHIWNMRLQHRCACDHCRTGH